MQVLVKRSAPNPLADKAGDLVKTEPLCVQYSASPYTLSGTIFTTMHHARVCFVLRLAYASGKDEDERQLLFTVTRGVRGVARLYSVSAVHEPKDPRHRGVVVSQGSAVRVRFHIIRNARI